MVKFACICLGGFLGTGVRYWMDGVLSRRFGETFPVGTLAINVLGSLAIGAIFVLSGSDSRVIVSVTTRQFLMIGVLGGFTTFSSFSLQTLTLLRDGELGAAMLNVGISVTAGLLAAWCGEELAKRIVHLT